jgi:hypothetical protein
MPDGRNQEPGGWNRFAIEVSDLDATVETLREAGARFRNDIVTGVGGKQILLEDLRAIRSNFSNPQLPKLGLETRTKGSGRVHSTSARVTARV